MCTCVHEYLYTYVYTHKHLHIPHTYKSNQTKIKQLYPDISSFKEPFGFFQVRLYGLSLCCCKGCLSNYLLCLQVFLMLRTGKNMD